MMNPTPEDIVTKIHGSAKYRTVWPSLIRRIAEQELAKQGNMKSTVKAVKKTLHQVAGAFFERKMSFGRWAEELQQCEGLVALKAHCKKLMQRHASTRERMGCFQEMYREIFTHTGPVTSILDLGCGLNPLSLLWMPVKKDIRYEAFDIYIDQIDFLNSFFQIAGCNGEAYLCDISDRLPQVEADVGLILKVLPLLDHLPDCDALYVLQQLRVRWLVVSYPVASLGGHKKGMTSNYAARFEDMVQHESWSLHKIIHPSELVYIIDKR